MAAKENPRDHSFAVKLPLDLVIWSLGFSRTRGFWVICFGHALVLPNTPIVPWNATDTSKLPLEFTATVKPNARRDPSSQNVTYKANVYAKFFKHWKTWQR